MVPPPHPITPHPHDRPLLRPLASLSRAPNPVSTVALLRRFDPATNRPDVNVTPPKPNRPSQTAQREPQQASPKSHSESREHVLKALLQGFDRANPESASADAQAVPSTPEEVEAWTYPQHPSRPDLHLVDQFSILPDLDAYPDAGAYIVVKFATNPVAASSVYDDRLELAVLRPLDIPAEKRAAQQAATAAHLADPSRPAPQPTAFDYECFIPRDPTEVGTIRRALNPRDPHGADPGSDEATSVPSFRYERIRAYETSKAANTGDGGYHELALAMYDPASADIDIDHDSSGSSRAGRAGRPRQRALYYYPIIQRCQIRPRRSHVVHVSVHGHRPRSAEEEDDQVDLMDVVVREPSEMERRRRAIHRHECDPTFPVHVDALDEVVADISATPSLQSMPAADLPAPAGSPNPTITAPAVIDGESEMDN